MNKDRICEVIVSCCRQCPNHYYYNDEEWICKKTFEHLENLEEFGKECPLKKGGGGMRVKTIENKETKLYYNEEINEVQGCIEINIHIENDDDLLLISNEINNLKNNYKFKTRICEGEE